MIELGQFLSRQLQQLPPDHPDRREIEKYLTDVRKKLNKSKKPQEAAPVLNREAFVPEEKEALTKEGLVVVRLVGQSIAEQKSQDCPFWYITEADPRFLNLPSRATEVAFNPNPGEVFIPRSNNCTLKQQLEMIQEHSDRLQRRLGMQTVEAIMGEAPDYTETAFVYLTASGERLFGVDYGYNYARTKTPTVGTRVALVGRFHATGGLHVDDWHRGYGDPRVFVSPLVVPKS